MFSLSDNTVANKHSKLFGLRSVLPSVFSSEWSFCQFHLDKPGSICSFSAGRGKDAFVVVGFSGIIYTCEVDKLAKNKICSESGSTRGPNVVMLALSAWPAIFIRFFDR